MSKSDKKKRYLPAGQRTEYATKQQMETATKGKSPVFHDVLSPDGKAQYDNIMVTRKGVYLGESKEYKGRIYGEKYGSTVDQYDFEAGKTRKLPNPVSQNYGHVASLQNEFNLPREAIVPFVSMGYDNWHPSTDNGMPVLGIQDVKGFIEEQEHTRKNCLTRKQVKEIKKKLAEDKNNPNFTNKEHIEYVNSKHPKK